MINVYGRAMLSLTFKLGLLGIRRPLHCILCSGRETFGKLRRIIIEIKPDSRQRSVVFFLGLSHKWVFRLLCVADEPCWLLATEITGEMRDHCSSATNPEPELLSSSRQHRRRDA